MSKWTFGDGTEPAQVNSPYDKLWHQCERLANLLEYVLNNTDKPPTRRYVERVKAELDKCRVKEEEPKYEKFEALPGKTLSHNDNGIVAKNVEDAINDLRKDVAELKEEESIPHVSTEMQGVVKILDALEVRITNLEDYDQREHLSQHHSK